MAKFIGFIGFIGFDQNSIPVQNTYGEVLVFKSKEHLDQTMSGAGGNPEKYRAQRLTAASPIRKKKTIAR